MLRKESPSELHRRSHQAGLTHRRFAPSVMALCLLISWTLAPRASLAGGGCVRGAVNCSLNTMGTINSCTASVMCSGGPSWALTQAGSMNVTACLPASTSAAGPTLTFMVTARANVASSTDRACTWSYQIPGMRALGSTISITSADGLPVELMDFSIEDDSEAEPDDTEPSSEP